ncbi:hypothetical protein, partial [Acetobacter cerevisiae]|uniref:hypothetical protein n=1 Tax=Acetobacter cerevisiae TaxID=178900 RepID=UPI001ADF779E
SGGEGGTFRKRGKNRRKLSQNNYRQTHHRIGSTSSSQEALGYPQALHGTSNPFYCLFFVSPIPMETFCIISQL